MRYVEQSHNVFSFVLSSRYTDVQADNWMHAFVYRLSTAKFSRHNEKRFEGWKRKQRDKKLKGES